MTNYDVLLEKVRELGMDYKWARMFVKKLADDEISFPAADEVKRWALERGFYPGRVEMYGLTRKIIGNLCLIINILCSTH